MRTFSIGYQTRLTFEVPDFDNISFKTRPSGIRCHTNFIVIFFLRLFGKLAENKSGTIHLNRASLEKWLNRHKNEEFLQGFNLKNSGVDGLVKLCEQEITRREETEGNQADREKAKQAFREFRTRVKEYISTPEPNEGCAELAQVFFALLKIPLKNNSQNALFDPNTGEFLLDLKKEKKCWFAPGTEKAKRWTPKGCVFLFGNDKQKEIRGKFDKTTQQFTFETGVSVHTRAQLFFNYEIPANGTIKKIARVVYPDGEKRFRILVESPLGNVNPGIPADIFIDGIKKGEKIRGDHETYLKLK